MVVDDHPIWREAAARTLTEAGVLSRWYRGLRRSGAPDRRRDPARCRTARPQPARYARREVTQHLLTALPSVRVLMLSASGQRQDVLDAVTAGASGYLLKSAEPGELVEAVRSTAAGHAVFTPGLAGLVLGEYRRLAQSGGEPAAGKGRAERGPGGTPAPQLTERETEVLRLVATGMTYPQIAARLSLSPRTVQNHVQNTLSKLQLHNKAQLVRYALEQGVELE